MLKIIRITPKTVLFSTVLGVLLLGLNACYDGGDLCSRSRPEELLLKNHELKPLKSSMVWLRESKNDTDTITLEIKRVDTVFKTFWYNDFDDICSNNYYNYCIIYCEEVNYQYTSNAAFGFERIVSPLSCPIRFSVNLGDYNEQFQVESFYDDRYVYNRGNQKYIVSKDSGLVYLELKTANVTIKRIQ